MKSLTLSEILLDFVDDGQASYRLDCNKLVFLMLGILSECSGYSEYWLLTVSGRLFVRVAQVRL